MAHREIRFEAIKDGEPYYGSVRLIGEGPMVVLDREQSMALWLGMQKAQHQGADFPRAPREGYIEISFEDLTNLEKR